MSALMISRTRAFSTRRAPRITDVYRSDFIQDSGTPLQWLCAWEVVGERERAQNALIAAVLSMAIMVVSGIPMAVDLVRIAPMIAGGSDA